MKHRNALDKDVLNRSCKNILSLGHFHGDLRGEVNVSDFYSGCSHSFCLISKCKLQKLI